jgi:hypothetical protein
MNLQRIHDGLGIFMGFCFGIAIACSATLFAMHYFGINCTP